MVVSNLILVVTVFDEFVVGLVERIIIMIYDLKLKGGMSIDCLKW